MIFTIESLEHAYNNCTNVNESTKRIYMCYINKIKQWGNIEFETADDLINIFTEHHMSNNQIYSILGLLRCACVVNNVDNKVKDIVYTLYHDYNKISKDDQYSHRLITRWTTDSLIEFNRSLQIDSYRTMTAKLVIGMYTLIPPLRNDYNNVHIIDNVANSGVSNVASNVVNSVNTIANSGVSSVNTIANSGVSNVVNSANTIANSGVSSVVNSVNTIANSGVSSVVNSVNTIANSGVSNVASSANTIANSGVNNVTCNANTIANSGVSNIASNVVNNVTCNTNTIANSSVSNVVSSANTIANSGVSNVASNVVNNVTCNANTIANPLSSFNYYNTVTRELKVYCTKSKKYHSVTVPDELANIIAETLRFMPREYLFVTQHGKPFSNTSNMYSQIIKCLRVIINEDSFTVNTFRHLYASKSFTGTVQDRIAAQKGMLHNAENHLRYGH